jgi:MFS family permease
MTQLHDDQMNSQSPIRSYLTLAFCTLLHAFTHAYGSILLPLLVVISVDLGLPRVEMAARLVTVYGLVYCVLSYGAGMLADRFNRKTLLGIGLIGNAVAVGLMGLTQAYWGLIALAVLAGVFGTIFHPSANALIPAHFPKNPGMGIGIMGIGSGLGFFAGPRFGGWRAETVERSWVAGAWNWQVPLLEAGIVGVLFGILFLIIAREAPHEKHEERREGRPLGHLRGRVIAIAAVLGWRDFAGVATSTLVSIYLQKAHGFDVKQTGWIVGGMMLISMVANPLAVWMSQGGRRLLMLTVTLIGAGILLAAVPHVPVEWILPMLAAFQIFHLGSYAIGEAGMLERVSPAVRGRVVGIFLTVAGTAASCSSTIVAAWTDWLGERANRPSGYYLLFAVLGGMMLFASLSARLIANLGEREEQGAFGPAEALSPATMEPVG